MAELDAPWAGYVEGVERLARPDADNALRELEAKVSEAILHALENQVILENKVSYTNHETEVYLSDIRWLLWIHAMKLLFFF